MPAVAAIVLAAGGSTRMGRPKQLIELDGETLVHRAARLAVEAGCDPVVVVTGRDHDAITTAVAALPVTCAHNADWLRGMGTSIRIGLARVVGAASAAVPRDSTNSKTTAEAAPTQPVTLDAVLIHLCDQPLIDAAALRALIDRWAASSKPVVVSAWNDTIGPPVIVDASLTPHLAAIPDDTGAKAIWADRPDWIDRVACPAAAFDVDTPADLVRLPVEPV